MVFVSVYFAQELLHRLPFYNRKICSSLCAILARTHIQSHQFSQLHKWVINTDKKVSEQLIAWFILNAYPSHVLYIFCIFLFLLTHILIYILSIGLRCRACLSARTYSNYKREVLLWCCWCVCYEIRTQHRRTTITLTRQHLKRAQTDTRGHDIGLSYRIIFAHFILCRKTT